MKEDLAACLEGFRGSGQLESSGEFTLSRDHAQKKLQQFALPEPRLYVLNMVAGAVVGKASFVEFKADADELWMSCDARLEDPSELESFESVALSNRAGSPLKEFAIGLGGLLPLQPARVTLEVRDPRGSGRLSWDGEKYRYQELPETVAEPGVKLYVRERLGLRSCTPGSDWMPRRHTARHCRSSSWSERCRIRTG